MSDTSSETQRSGFFNGSERGTSFNNLDNNLDEPFINSLDVK